jgi:hypothetical protein
VGNAYRMFFGMPEEDRPLAGPSSRCKNNIEIDLRNVVRGCGLDSFGSGWGPLACSCEHGNELSDYMKGEKYLD